jgi:hypothetical protein
LIWRGVPREHRATAAILRISLNTLSQSILRFGNLLLDMQQKVAGHSVRQLIGQRI